MKRIFEKIFNMINAIPIKLRFAINTCLILVLCYFLLVFIGGPKFTDLMAYRQAEKANLVGPAKVLGVETLPSSSSHTPFDHVIAADDGTHVILYAYSKESAEGYEHFSEQLTYRKKTGLVTVSSVPALWHTWDFRHLFIFLFDSHPEAVRAQLDLELRCYWNDEIFSKQYQLQSQRETDGYFLFEIKHKQLGEAFDMVMDAEETAMYEFSQLCSNGELIGCSPLGVPATVRLYDSDGTLLYTQSMVIDNTDLDAH